MHSVTPHWRKWFSCYPWESIADTVLIRSGSVCYFSLSPGTPFDLNLVCLVCAAIVSESSYSPIVSGDSVPPESSTTSGFYYLLSSLLHRSIILEGRILIKTSYLRLKAPKSLSLCTWSSSGSIAGYLITLWMPRLCYLLEKPLAAWFSLLHFFKRLGQISHRSRVRVSN